MLSAALSKLLSISSDPVCARAPTARLELELTGDASVEHSEMLQAKNGFYAFLSALHVFPSCESAPGRSLQEWNEPSLWKSAYGDVLDGCLCFAEDIFGEQFCLRDGEILRFDPEQATLTPMASSLSEWAEKVLANYNYESGYQIADGWQEKHGPLAIGRRLIPTQPFVLKGSYEIYNFGDVDGVESMRFRANLWRQLRDLTPGTIVTLVTTE